MEILISIPIYSKHKNINLNAISYIELKYFSSLFLKATSPPSIISQIPSLITFSSIQPAFLFFLNITLPLEFLSKIKIPYASPNTGILGL